MRTGWFLVLYFILKVGGTQSDMYMAAKTYRLLYKPHRSFSPRSQMPGEESAEDGTACPKDDIERFAPPLLAVGALGPTKLPLV